MNNLSIFVDESGDFGKYRPHSPYYIIAMVLHEQSKDLSKEIIKLNTELENLGYKNPAVHTEPLIRREEDYLNMSPAERRSIFTKLFYFVSRSDIRYKSFIFHKKEFSDILRLEKKMAREISAFIRDNLSYFQRFDRIILYYDNGQHELSKILNTVLATELSHFKMKKAQPCDYKLFQAADLICTLELLRLKSETGRLTRSETLIFHSRRALKKDFLKGLSKKCFQAEPP